MRTTFGIELEIPNVNTRVAKNLRHNGWGFVEDGSIRNYRNHSLFPNTRQEKCGIEAVSPVLTVEKLHQMYPLLQFIKGFQPQELHNNAIHIHVGIPRNTQKGHIKRLIKYYQWMKYTGEELFFNVSVPSDHFEHRGMKNSFIYCRPLRSPPYCKDGTVWLPSHGHVEKATTSNEYEYALGRLDLRDRKWWASRYTGVNFCTALSPLKEYHLGTIEFRMFNMTTNIPLITAWVLACTGSVNAFFTSGKFLGPIDGISSWKQYMEVKEYKRILRGIRKDVYTECDLSPVRSHLRSRFSWTSEPFSQRMETLSPLNIYGVQNARKVENTHPIGSVRTHPYTNINMVF